jgi:hypothetical protein
MVTRKELHSELDRVSEEHLDEIYQLIKTFTSTKSNGKRPGLLAQLSKIKIEAPEDYSANFDLYASGEKRVEDNLR